MAFFFLSLRVEAYSYVEEGGRGSNAAHRTRKKAFFIWNKTEGRAIGLTNWHEENDIGICKSPEKRIQYQDARQRTIDLEMLFFTESAPSGNVPGLSNEPTGRVLRRAIIDHSWTITSQKSESRGSYSYSFFSFIVLDPFDITFSAAQETEYFSFFLKQYLFLSRRVIPDFCSKFLFC